MAEHIYKLAQGNTYNLVDMMIKIPDALVMTVSDAQIEGMIKLNENKKAHQLRVFDLKEKERESKESPLNKQLLEEREMLICLEGHLTSFEARSFKAKEIFNSKIKLENKQQSINEYQTSTRKSYSHNSVQLIETKRLEHTSFDSADDIEKAVRWEYTSYEPVISF
ncbi:MAG: hypothetical protein EZS28_016389 [Streblomastix strix]|uniref:Uncharacterized protein n=1 Tax=Streblomastix strix TaxID=222440 RepID=A0A5J4VZT8_9EUKA|nr:MAG: hypothetical protein EZS28_016389 [Streblomastix strix]